MNSIAKFVLVSAFALTASCSNPDPNLSDDGGSTKNALEVWKLGKKPVKIAIFDQALEIDFDKAMDAAFEKNKLDAVLFLGSLYGEPEEASSYKRNGHVVFSKSMETAFKVDGRSIALDLNYSDLHDDCPKMVQFPGITITKCNQLGYSQKEAMILEKRATIHTIWRRNPYWKRPWVWIMLIGLVLLVSGGIAWYFLYQK